MPVDARPFAAPTRARTSLAPTALGTSRSGRGDGIAPVTPPTPPDVRFSRIRRLTPVDVTGVRPRRLRVLQTSFSAVIHNLSACSLPAAHGRFASRNPPAGSSSAAVSRRPVRQLAGRLRVRLPACLLRLRPFAPAAFTAFIATVASADFCPSLNRQISPGKVHELSGRAVGLYPMRLSVTVGFRVSQHTHRSHMASLSVPVRTVVPSIHPSSSTAVARSRLGLHYGCCHHFRQPPFRLLVHAHAGHPRLNFQTNPSVFWPQVFDSTGFLAPVEQEYVAM